MKNFCSSKDTIKRVKRQATEWDILCDTYVQKLFFTKDVLRTPKININKTKI